MILKPNISDVLEDSWIEKYGKSSKRQVEIEGIAYSLFDIKCIIIIACMTDSQTVNQKYYKEVLLKIRERVRKNIEELWKKDSWLCTRTTCQSKIPYHWSRFLRASAFPCLNILRIPRNLHRETYIYF